MKLTTLILLASMMASSAANYYVRTDGSDANAGTSNTSGGAWLTVQKAANTMTAGDTVTVAAGTYAEKVTTGANGSSGNPITYLAASQAAIVGGFAVNHPYQVINGFKLTGAGVSTFSGTITLGTSANNLTVTGCLFDGQPGAGSGGGMQVTMGYSGNVSSCTISNCSFLNADNDSTAVNTWGTGHLIVGNTFTSTNGADALRIFSSWTTIRGNTFTNWSSYIGSANHPDIIQTFANTSAFISTNVVFERNLATNCFLCQIGNLENASGVGKIQDWTFRNNVFSEVDYAFNVFITNCSILNNTFVRCTTNTAMPVILSKSGGGGDAANSSIKNNIFYLCGDNPANNSSGWYVFGGGVTGCTADYNLVVGTGAGTTKTGFSETHGINGSDPLFTSATIFTLQAASPAIAAGTNLSSLFTDDFASATRGETWDLGAYEYVSGGGGGGSGTNIIAIMTATNATFGTVILR